MVHLPIFVCIVVGGAVLVAVAVAAAVAVVVRVIVTVNARKAQ